MYYVRFWWNGQSYFNFNNVHLYRELNWYIRMKVCDVRVLCIMTTTPTTTTTSISMMMMMMAKVVTSDGLKAIILLHFWNCSTNQRENTHLTICVLNCPISGFNRPLWMFIIIAFYFCFLNHAKRFDIEACRSSKNNNNLGANVKHQKLNQGIREWDRDDEVKKRKEKYWDRKMNANFEINSLWHLVCACV